jgi:hypothetical protein
MKIHIRCGHQRADEREQAERLALSDGGVDFGEEA